MKTRCNDCCSQQSVGPESCGCCEGMEIITPQEIFNRPGLSQIKYRIGTHASFLESMTARLTGYYLEKPDTDGKKQKIYPLGKLTTRDKFDASLALLDAWSNVADIMTFYQERIANEGYLRTATERRSILELSRLVGYQPRPGVSSSVYLAYSVDQNFKEETILSIGSRAQSIPGPDELPQSFETSEELKARAQWNNLKPRVSRPQTLESIKFIDREASVRAPRVYLKGLDTNLKLNDPLLIGLNGSTPEFYRVQELQLDSSANRTLVILTGGSSESPSGSNSVNNSNLLNDLVLPPSTQPKNTLALKRTLAGQFKNKASPSYSSVASFTPKLKRTLKTAAANAILTDSNDVKVYAFRIAAPLFGHNASKEPAYDTKTGQLLRQSQWFTWNVDTNIESGNTLYLDRQYPKVQNDTFIAVERKDAYPVVYKTTAVETISRNEYGISGELTKVTLNQNWWDVNVEPSQNDFSDIQNTKVYAEPEELELAEEPIDKPVCGGEDDLIELDGFYDGLESGRWVIVSGERQIAGTSGVRFSELAMLSEVTQDVINNDVNKYSATSSSSIRSDEKLHTFVKLAEKLAYCFKRDSIVIHGNVVKATNGESRHEILGSGDAAKAFQSFELKQFPLTYVSATNPSGINSSLKVFVNNIEWHEANSLFELEANNRNFVTKTDNENKTKITFGNGEKGARLSTGAENVRAIYRSGIGKAGNVNAEQISMLSTKPLGVKEVINPLPASGGANRETRDQARKNAPLAIKALDRLVSVQDYQDFSRVYAGIGKAQAVEISDGRQQLVHVTIAGAEDIPIDESSDLFRNLRTALNDFGDPQQAVQLAVRELMFITIEASVAIQPDYQWDSVEPKLRKQLLEAFSFERREIGQSVVLSEVIKVMQSVRGVAYIDVNAFGGVPEKRALNKQDIDRLKAEHNSTKETEKFVLPYNRQILTPDDITNTVAEILYSANSDGILTSIRKPVAQRLAVDTAALYARIPENRHIQPGQLAYLTPEVPSTLILNQIENIS